jgi:hypothetical protein
MTALPPPCGRRLVRLWLAFAVATLTVSLASGYRASRAARAPQYLFSKTQVLVEEPYVPANAVEAALEATLREAEDGPSTVTVKRPMLVLGLLDGAVPILVASGAGVWCGRRMYGRIAKRGRSDVP